MADNPLQKMRYHHLYTHTVVLKEWRILDDYRLLSVSGGSQEANKLNTF